MMMIASGLLWDDVHQFAWPGDDRQLVPGRKDRLADEVILQKLCDTVIGRILALAAAARALVPRG